MTPWVIAHRGASAQYPENTLLAFEQGLQQGAQAIELDIQRSADGHPIVLHDATLQRTTDGRGPCHAFTLAQLHRLDAGQGERIPVLAELLAQLAGRGITLFLEIKDPQATRATVRAVDDAVQAGGWEYRQLPLIGFDAAVLRAARDADPSLALGVSASSVTPAHLALAQELGAEALIPDIRKLSRPVMEQARRQGLRVFTWTCNRDREIAKALALGVDGVMGDDPARLAAWVKEKNACHGRS